MTTRDLVGFIAFPIALLIAAWLIRSQMLWSMIGSVTIPWLCAAIAVALLIVGTCGLLAARPLAEISWKRRAALFFGVMILLGLGLGVDGVAYGEGTRDRGVTFVEWLGFGVILAGAFLASAGRSSRSRAPSDA